MTLIFDSAAGHAPPGSWRVLRTRRLPLALTLRTSRPRMHHHLFTARLDGLSGNLYSRRIRKDEGPCRHTIVPRRGWTRCQRLFPPGRCSVCVYMRDASTPRVFVVGTRSTRVMNNGMRHCSISLGSQRTSKRPTWQSLSRRGVGCCKHGNSRTACTTMASFGPYPSGSSTDSSRPSSLVFALDMLFYRYVRMITHLALVQDLIRDV